MSRAIDRLAAATRFFALADGRLAAFQGGEPARRADVAAARALDAGGGEIPRAAPYGGYQRLEGGPLQLIVDAGAPAAGRFAGSACAQPGAITVACEGRRLIAGSAWSAQRGGRWRIARPGGRLMPGADGDARGRVLRHGLLALGAPERLESRLAAVAAERHQEGGETWLDVSHDGWRGPRPARAGSISTPRPASCAAKTR